MKHARPKPFTALVVALCAATSLAGCGLAGDAASGEATDPGSPSASEPELAELEPTWTWVPPPAASPGMPAADGNDVALTAGRMRLVMLDRTGTLRWEAYRQGLRSVGPVFSDDLVLAATEDGLSAFDRRSGRPRWEARLDERTNTPAVVDGTAIVTTWDGSMAGIDLRDGRIRWRAALGGNSLGPPAGAGKVATATFATQVVAGAVAVDAATGRQRWKVSLPAGGTSAPAVVDAGAGKVVVMVAADLAAHALSLEDGSERWRRELDGAGSPEVPPLALPGAKVLVAHRLGGMAMLDARDGTQEWTAQSDAAAVYGGPAGPGPNGWFAMPLYDGSLMLAKAGATEFRDPDGRVTGVALGPDNTLLVGTAQGSDAGLLAASGW